MRERPFRSLWLRRRGRGKRRSPFWPSLVLGLTLAFLFIRWFDAALRPQLVALSETQIRNQLTHIADQAVTQALAKEELSYRDMVSLQIGERGEVTTLSTDTGRLNLLRACVLEDVIAQVGSLDNRSLGVPLGTLTGIDLLSALGPKLPVQVISVASAQGNYRNEFTDAGINQTLHRVMLDITVAVQLLLPGGIVETTLTTPVCVAETVIIGQVPQTYLNWNP